MRQKGNFVKQDIELLQHEYFETRLEILFKNDYITHNASNLSSRTWNPDEFVTTSTMSLRP